jgi:hypothetical protein
MAAAVGALLVAALLVSGFARDGEREWQVAANPRATADEIIDAGHASAIATSKNQMVVTWEVEPEDDEGPYQGAWRLYDRDKGRVADGKFGTVREASARIDAVAVRDGFLLTDYVDHKRHFLDRSGKLTPADLATAKPGPSLAGGVLGQGQSSDEEGWEVILPDKRQVVRLTDLPTKDVQGVQLTSDGTVWVLLPWQSDGPYRIAHSKDGKAPWTTETIPLPEGSGTDGEGISADGDRLFVVASHERGDRMPVDAILSREAGEKGWKRIDASGIADDLTSAPRIAVLPKGRLVAMASGEGAWVQRRQGSAFATLHPPRTHEYSIPGVQKVGIWLWSSEQNFGNSLHYSYDYGKTWRKFYR